MVTPRRRSSRNQRTPNQSNATPLARKLSSLLERDESPAGVQSNLDAVVQTPLAPPNTAIARGRFDVSSSAIKTPQTTSKIGFGEMHPSKTHQSTTKPSTLLSSHPVNDVSKVPPSKLTIAKVAQDTPSKSRVSLPSHMNSPTFDFSFERPESDLSSEAQKIMDSVREEAAKIKAQMVEERKKQEHNDGETDQLYGFGGRRIATPRGKSGRFSDVHKHEFKKMDSIANHASAWKTKLPGTSQTLKRSPSKAGLDETTPKSIISMTKSKSMRSLLFNSGDMLENTSPGKRARLGYGDDTSSGCPVSRDNDDSILPTTRPSSILPSAANTPTKASLARSASVKNMKTSMVPSLSRSASTKTLGGGLHVPKTEGSNKYAASLSRFSGSMKSILHRAQPKFSDDPTKVAAGTHLPMPKADFRLNKDLPSLPSSPFKDSIQQSPTIKRVGFGDTTVHHLTASPSMSKIPTAAKAHHQPSNPPSPGPKTHSEGEITYPLLATSPNITTRRPLPKPTNPGDFTFRADKTITFSSASLTSPTGTTIRHVRPSGLPTPLGLPGAWEVLPGIEHGIGNKKRKHGTTTEDLDNGGDENVAMSGMDDEGGENGKEYDRDGDGGHRAKKQRTGDDKPLVKEPSVQAREAQQSPLKRRFGGAGGVAAAAGGSRIPRKGMSLGRLNVLASPKKRR